MQLLRETRLKCRVAAGSAPFGCGDTICPWAILWSSDPIGASRLEPGKREGREEGTEGGFDLLCHVAEGFGL